MSQQEEQVRTGFLMTNARSWYAGSYQM